MSIIAAAAILALPLLTLSAGERPGDGETGGDAALRDAGAAKTPPAPGKNEMFGFDIGMSGGYSTGVSAGNFHYKPFANLFLRHRYVKFTAGIGRYQDYLITNGMGKYERVNFTQPRLALSLYPHEMLELYGEYRFSAGDPSHYYRGHEGTAGFLLDINPVSIDASVNVRKTAYRFKSFDWQSTFSLLYSRVSNSGHVTSYYLINTDNTRFLEDISATASCSWSVIDTTSLDATYYYMKSVFDYPSDTYHVHTGRVGVYSDVWKYVSLYGGISLGADSERYLIAGGDLGLTFDILGYASLSATYMPGYYKTLETVSALDRIVEAYALYFDDYGILGSDNPYMRPSLVGKSFMNHSVSFSVSFKY